jgi:hypothetical protein
MMKPSNAECAVGTVHTASAKKIGTRGKRCAAGRASHADEAKSADGNNRQLEIALVVVRQLIVFHRQNHRRLANRRQTDTPNMASA